MSFLSNKRRLSKRREIIWLIIFAIGSLGGCRSDGEQPQNNNRQSVESPADQVQGDPVSLATDEEKLLLIRSLPLGISYEDASKRVPDLGELEIEGYSEYLHQQGLAKAFTEMSVFDRQARLELNFENNILYSYYFRLSALDRATASDLYRRLQSFYSERYGRPREEQQVEGAVENHSSFWTNDTFSVVMTASAQPDQNILSWGFQSSPP